MAFGSTDYSEGFIPKIFTPGTYLARIVDIKLDYPPYKPEACFITVMLEGTDMGDDFKGITVDKQNPSLGSFRGQVGYVKNGEFPLSDFQYQGRDISRDTQIDRWLTNLLKQMKVWDLMVEKVAAKKLVGEEYEDLNEYLDAVKSVLINPDLWGTFVLAGREYFTEGYDKPNYYLHFPKSEGKLHAFSAFVDNKNEPIGLVTFDAKKHIIPKYEKPVENVTSFGGQSTPTMQIPVTPVINTAPPTILQMPTAPSNTVADFGQLELPQQ